MLFSWGNIHNMADQENDDDIWDSWEDMAESGELERRMEEREREHMKLRDEIDKNCMVPFLSKLSCLDLEVKTAFCMKLTKELLLFDPTVHVLVDTDSNRTKYNPQVRILRRDPNDPATVSDNNKSDKSKKIHKTLAQREKEYADARARILGEATENSADETCPPVKVNTEEKLPDNLIRQPRGPDGTHGFTLKR